MEVLGKGYQISEISYREAKSWNLTQGAQRPERRGRGELWIAFEWLPRSLRFAPAGMRRCSGRDDGFGWRGEVGKISTVRRTALRVEHPALQATRCGAWRTAWEGHPYI